MYIYIYVCQSYYTGGYRSLRSFPWLFSVVVILVLVAYDIYVSSQGQGCKNMAAGKGKMKGHKRPIFIGYHPCYYSLGQGAVTGLRRKKLL
jgi:hypothetical protein